MTTTEAHIEVVCPGMLEVLSVGKGDLKLTLGGEDPNDVANARRIIEEMLRKGYSIYVETDKGPSRVKKFNPKRMTYIITELTEEAEELAAAPTPPTSTNRPAGRPKKSTTEREVPVAGSRATSVGRTAGG